jgi:hypothetical protein
MVWEYRIRHKIRFLYFIKPNQIHQWDVKEPWTGYHILISPLLLQEYNIDFSFLQYEINEALFLTEDEQIQIENLYKSLMNTKRQLRIRYLNCLLQFDFFHVVKFYKRQFYSRQPLYNKIVVEFKIECFLC